MFRREVVASSRKPSVMIDSALVNTGYADNFGFEWTHIDGFAGKEIMSHGHVFGRFALPRDFFRGKSVVDIGCGNGRIGRLIAPHCDSYAGVDLSEAVYSFPDYTQRPAHFSLTQASATDLPFIDSLADVTLCWGVLHHVDRPEIAFAELDRITRPGGTILIFVYPDSYNGRKNLNKFMRGLPLERSHLILEQLSDAMDEWRQIDAFYADILAGHVSLAFKQSQSWQRFQWYDGVTPRYHWALEQPVQAWAQERGMTCRSVQAGCFRLDKPQASSAFFSERVAGF